MSHDDFAVEPVPGLPERPPEGEAILWQGRPDWWRLNVEAFKIYWVLGYFGLLAAWRFISLSDLRGPAEAFALSSPFLILALIAGALLSLCAFVQARSTIYTITNRRIAMRIGAALTVTLNLPYTQIARADLAVRKDGSGTIVLGLKGRPKISYLVMWPHVRPWRFAAPEPALRGIKNAHNIARIIAENAESRINEPRIARAPIPQTVAAE